MDGVRGTPVCWFVPDLACLAQAVTDHEIHMATHAGPARPQGRRGLRTPRRRTPIKVEARLVRSCSAMMIFACAYAVAGALVSALVQILQALPSQDLVGKVVGILTSDHHGWRSAPDPGMPEAVNAEPAVPGREALC
jgi:hypothetical protein